MTLIRLAGTTILGIALFLTVLASGCNKERIVESTEYIHDIQYVESPPDTVMVHDTVYRSDSLIVNTRDTVRITDTLRITNTVHDTVRITSVVHDTVRITSIVHDTVLKAQCTASTQMAIDAMISQAEPLLSSFLMEQVGQNDGWVFHLSPSQMDISQASSTVWDIYSVVDYWAADWSGYYQVEMYWRMTFNGGDASNPANWTMGDPPASPKYQPGVNPTEKAVTGQSLKTSVRE